MLLDNIFAVIRSVGSVLNVFESFQEGTVNLQATDGTEVIEIKTRKAPKELWLSLGQSSGTPVCYGDTDFFSYDLTTEGFILYADISSNSVQINWHAIFESNN